MSNQRATWPQAQAPGLSLAVELYYLAEGSGGIQEKKCILPFCSVLQAPKRILHSKQKATEVAAIYPARKTPPRLIHPGVGEFSGALPGAHRTGNHFKLPPNKPFLQ